MKMNNSLSVWAMSVVLATMSVSCNNDDNNTPDGGNQGPDTENPTPGTPNSVVLANHSKTPAFVYAMPGFDNLEIFSLISSEDKLQDSPDFVFGGQPDGAGFMKEILETYIL